jgi:hypothetical protein
MADYQDYTNESSGMVTTDRVQNVFLSPTQTVLEMMVTEGQAVKKGDVLFTYDTTLSDIALMQKDLAVQQTKLDLEAAQKELRVINSYVPIRYYEVETPEPTEPEVFEPNRFDVRLSDSSVRAGSKVIVTATTGKDVEYITVNGRKVTTYSGSQFSNTRVWQISVDAKDVGRLNVSVVCYNRDKLASQALVRTVTVTRQYVDVSGIVQNLTTSMVKDLIAGIVDYLRIGR